MTTGQRQDGSGSKLGDGRPSLSDTILGYLRDTAFPGAEVVAQGAPGDGHGYYWVLAPYGEESSSWVVPIEARYGLSFLKKWHPALHHDYWKELAAAYAKDTLGGRYGVYLLRVPTDRNRYWEQFGWRTSIPPVVVAYVGARRPWQKVVAGLVQRETGLPAMVVKFPLVESARGYIIDEARTLKTLEAEKPGMAPRSLFVDEGRAIAAEEALVGDDAGMLLEPLHLPFLCGLADPAATVSLAAYGDRLLERASSLDMATELQGLVGRVCEMLDDSAELPAVWVHGDLHAGNLILRRNGRVQAVDWAFARRGGLPFHDIARARLANRLSKREGSLDADVDHECLEAYGRTLGVSTALYPKLVAWYAARTLLRHEERGESGKAASVAAKLSVWMDGQRHAGP